MMDDESRLNLEDDHVAVEEFLAEFDGKLLQRPEDAATGVYWVTLHPRSTPTETYIARIAWTRYPDAAPSVKFADSIGGSLSIIKAWPQCAGYRPGNYDICKPFTAEGFAVHPEWRTGPHAWQAAGNPFLFVASQLQDDLNHRYQGRAQ
jgi:hypothetical protein